MASAEYNHRGETTVIKVPNHHAARRRHCHGTSHDKGTLPPCTVANLFQVDISDPIHGKEQQPVVPQPEAVAVPDASTKRDGVTTQLLVEDAFHLFNNSSNKTQKPKGPHMFYQERDGTYYLKRDSEFWSSLQALTTCCVKDEGGLRS